jgi:serine protease Do
LQYPFDPGVKVGSGRFLIQDPDWRARILPLFDFSLERPEERAQGQGTVFRLDPFGTCATAFHVFEEAFSLGGASGHELVVRKDRAIVALELEGIALGLAPIQPHQWRTMNGAYSILKVDKPPFEMPRMRNFTELLALDIPPSSAKPGEIEFLHADIVGWRPTIGETVLGIGYPSLDEEKGGSDDRPISQYMYGAYGRITDIEPLDLNRTRPWPMVRVEADWPGGMSGGPVFNAVGNVIGIISSGIDANSSTAMVFGGWGAVHNTFPSLDPSRPGWFVCQAILNRDERLLGVRRSRRAADEIVKQHDGAFASKISLNHATSEFVRLEL